MMQWNTTARSHLTSRISLDLQNTVTLEISFVLCLCPFSTGSLEGCMFWLPENISQRTAFSPQTLLWKNHSNPQTFVNGHLKHLYSKPQGGVRFGVRQAEHQSPVTSSCEQLHPLILGGCRNISASGLSQRAQDWEGTSKGLQTDGDRRTEQETASWDGFLTCQTVDIFIQEMLWEVSQSRDANYSSWWYSRIQYYSH